MVPSITAFPPQPPQPTQNTQPSPSLPTNGGRRSPIIGQVQRLLPTPPHNNAPTFDQERRLSPPPVQQQTMNPSNANQHYPRPGPRAPAASFPNRHQNLEEDWKMTPELLAEIDYATHQQAQYQANQPLSYPNGESPPALKGDRVRPADRLSPINPDNQQRGRREQQHRESPMTGGHHAASPLASSFEATLTPEKRISPAPLGSESHPANPTSHYTTRESPPVLRRAPATEQRINQSIVNQTPPLQAARNPDRSLPVQEEDENGGSSRTDWQDTDTLIESQFSSSPTPSSDLNADGKLKVHHDDDKKKAITHDEDRAQYGNRDSTEEENGFTPRSPTAALPEDNNNPYYPGPNVPIRVPVPVPLRPKGRNGSGDHIMRGLESTLLDSKQSHPVPSAPVPQTQQQQSQPPKYSEQRQPVQPQPQLNYQYQKPYPSQEYAYAQQTIRARNGQYLPPQPHVYPDDFQYADDSASAYIQSYMTSPRPDAPVPPTPHTATAAPSPSPAYRQRAVGSPYPFPFNHVRRNMQNQNSRLIANGLDPAAVTEQIARQWQVYAQNNHGNITDSTLSPSATPFQGDLFNQWAYHHTNRMMRGLHETASLHSSPSHQPIPLPIPPHFGAKKRDKFLNGRKQSYGRKPPPRVQSTQPRDTSPELSSSGEETAGDDRVNPAPDVEPQSTNEQGVSFTPTTDIPITEIPIEDLDEDADWVDEDDEDDYDDLIDLEYHPSFIKNVSKRRRKWEVGWENLIQAASFVNYLLFSLLIFYQFQMLDRQTDSTMILLASPSHSTKLHALRSRSIRRQPALSNSTTMDDIRKTFSRIAAQRRKMRPERSSLVDRLAVASSASGGDGSDGSAQSVEENLRRALDAALGSLGALGQVYEEREARVLEELRRSREDREQVELLLKQVLGDNNPLSNPAVLFSP